MMLEIIYQLVGIALGIVTLLTILYARWEALRAAHKAQDAADIAVVHSATALRTIDQIVENTNGMSHRLELLAGQAGEARGRAERDEG